MVRIEPPVDTPAEDARPPVDTLAEDARLALAAAVAGDDGSSSPEASVSGVIGSRESRVVGCSRRREPSRGGGIASTDSPQFRINSELLILIFPVERMRDTKNYAGE